jgi:hypothetical protein
MPAIDSYRAPGSGDVSQAINPWSWWISAPASYGFININTMQSADPGLEQRIVHNVASYGRQLGRMMEVLEALLAHTDSSGWAPQQQDALRDFRRLTAQIADYKSNQLLDAGLDADRLAHALDTLRRRDGAAFERIAAKLRPVLARD